MHVLENRSLRKNQIALQAANLNMSQVEGKAVMAIRKLQKGPKVIQSQNKTCWCSEGNDPGFGNALGNQIGDGFLGSFQIPSLPRKVAMRR